MVLKYMENQLILCSFLLKISKNINVLVLAQPSYGTKNYIIQVQIQYLKIVCPHLQPNILQHYGRPPPVGNKNTSSHKF